MKIENKPWTVSFFFVRGEQVGGDATKYLR